MVWEVAIHRANSPPRKDATPSDAFSGSRVLPPREKKMYVYLRNADDRILREASECGGILSSDKNKQRAIFSHDMSLLNGRIPYFYAWHGHRRIRCQSPRRTRKSHMCAAGLTHASTYARTHAPSFLCNVTKLRRDN